MKTSDLIASFIAELLASCNGTAELQRAELAERFHCVPSQINYVISTRFSPEHGYIVESRRGGGGYIRITRVSSMQAPLIMHMVNSIGDSLDINTARALVSNAYHSGAVQEQEARLMLAAVSDNALRAVPVKLRNRVRAGIFKQMLVNSIVEGV